MERKYTLIASKPNSSDYCKGCCMARYESEFIHRTGLTREELTKEIARLKATPLDYNEVGFEDILFFEEPDENDDAAYETRLKLEEEVFGEAGKLSAKIVEERKAAEAAEKAEKARREKEAAEAAERKKFEELRAKFEGKI